MKRSILSLLIGFFAVGVYAQNGTPVLLSNTYQHAFSDPLKKDLFKLTLIGKTILKGKVLFEIVTADHKVIHSETFPATDLYGDMDDDYFKPKQKIDTIKARFKSFLTAPHFKTPAINKNEKYDEDNYDKSVFNELKSDQGSIGFTYSHGYEGTYSIAWSKKKKAVVNYFSFD